MNRPSDTRAGFTMIEAMMTMVVLIVAFLGFAGLQIIGVQSNYFGDRMVQASALATDLAENIRQWPYTDSRLTSLTVPPLTSLTGSGLCWDLGSSLTTLNSGCSLEYSDYTADAFTPVPTHENALAGTTYLGLSDYLSTYSDGGVPGGPPGNGKPEFYRYWNVYDVNLGGTGSQTNGKLIQVWVRWIQPGFGFRQVTQTVFKRNPANIY